MARRRAGKPKHGPNVWVINYRGQYSVKEERIAGCLTAPVSQGIAITIARLIARANRSELIIQGEGGRIRARDSHGADPFPPRG